METLSFILGISAVLAILGVVVLVKTVIQVKKLHLFTSNLETEIANSIQREIQDNDLNVHKRIDQEIDRVNTIFNESISHADSRIDKLESKTILNLNERLIGLGEYFERCILKVKKENQTKVLKKESKKQVLKK